MSTMNERFNEASIAFGKILVLTEESTLSIAKIKSLTGAKSVKRIKMNENTEERFLLLHHTIRLGLKFNQNEYVVTPKLYQIEGDANSAFLLLHSNSVLALLDIQAKDFMQTHNSVNHCVYINKVRQMAEATLEEYKEYKPMIPASDETEFVGVNTQLIKLKRTFGKKLFNKSLVQINDFFVAKW